MNDCTPPSKTHLSTFSLGCQPIEGWATDPSRQDAADVKDDDDDRLVGAGARSHGQEFRSEVGFESLPDRLVPGPRRVAVTAAAVDGIRERAPEGIEVVVIDDDLDLETIDFLIPAAERSVLEALPRLTRVAVVQLLSAGTDWIDDQLPPHVTLCSARGARDGPVAEWIMAALLGASSRTLECARLQTWTTDRPIADLESWTLLIVGMGSIGRHLARLLGPFGVRVVGVVSQTRGDLYGIDELPILLPAADAVVVLTPLTDATKGLIGAKELAAMSDGALLVNAARGPVVDTNALLAEVRSGRLRAVLDVADPEPLPDGHPLWTAPGVLSMTPHIAGESPLGMRRAVELAARQLSSWAAGEELMNVVQAGSG